MTEALLRIENLSVEYVHGKKRLAAVRQVSLELPEGQTLGVVGESGCGKSTLALSILRLLPEKEGHISGGRILFKGRDILSLPAEDLRRLRGGDIGMVFQDPYSSLNPVLTLGEQIEEVLEIHQGARNKKRVLELFGHVRLPEPGRFYSSYPHQISGGQRQRVILAMALAANPKLLIADEPTTALDVTVQKEILDLLSLLQKEMKLAMLFITHNLGLVSERMDRVAVMYAGEIVETGPTAELFRQPRHPYTQGLLRSLPKLTQTAGRLPMLPGQPPDLKNVPSGCPFHPRCPMVFEPCAQQHPELAPRGGNPAACHLYPL